MSDAFIENPTPDQEAELCLACVALVISGSVCVRALESNKASGQTRMRVTMALYGFVTVFWLWTTLAVSVIPGLGRWVITALDLTQGLAYTLVYIFLREKSLHSARAAVARGKADIEDMRAAGVEHASHRHDQTRLDQLDGLVTTIAWLWRSLSGALAAPPRGARRMQGESPGDALMLTNGRSSAAGIIKSNT